MQYKQQRGFTLLDNSRYPTTDQGLNALIIKPDSEPAPRNYKEGGYIKRLPADPWQNEYQLCSQWEWMTL